MKIKAKLEKFNLLNRAAIPCHVSVRKELQKGNVVDIDEETANVLLSMNIVEKNKSKKSKKESK
jgi:hypothetical protein